MMESRRHEQHAPGRHAACKPWHAKRSARGQPSHAAPRLTPSGSHTAEGGARATATQCRRPSVCMWNDQSGTGSPLTMAVAAAHTGRRGKVRTGSHARRVAAARRLRCRPAQHSIRGQGLANRHQQSVQQQRQQRQRQRQRQRTRAAGERELDLPNVEAHALPRRLHKRLLQRPQPPAEQVRRGGGGGAVSSSPAAAAAATAQQPAARAGARPTRRHASASQRFQPARRHPHELRLLRALAAREAYGGPLARAELLVVRVPKVAHVALPPAAPRAQRRRDVHAHHAHRLGRQHHVLALRV